MQMVRSALIGLVAVVLAACGSDGGEVDRGGLVEKFEPVPLAKLSSAQIDGATAASGLQAISGLARCDVEFVPIEYYTLGARGESRLDAHTPVSASGVLLLPAGACAGQAYPLVAYAKGTDVQKPRTLANPQDPETFLLAAMYAAQGYAVVATDYLGYAKSSYPFHPYLHADSQASAVIDSIRAARGTAARLGAKLSGKVMLTGYSQGSHASMAAHRAAERDLSKEINVVAGAHLAGPYNLSGSFKYSDPNNPIAGVQFFVPFMIASYQKTYGNVYADPAQVFNAPYASYIESLLPSPTLNYTTLITTGALPTGTPKQAQDAMFNAAYLTDVRTNPSNAFYLNAAKNDLIDWTPKAPTLLCGGAGDPTVPPVLHQTVIKAAFDAKNLTNVVSVDVYPYVQQLFGINGAAPTNPLTPEFATYYGSYHGTYEPPLCHAQARGFFDRLK